VGIVLMIPQHERQKNFTQIGLPILKPNGKRLLGNYRHSHYSSVRLLTGFTVGSHSDQGTESN
jgi:hypothetical protein